MNAERPLQVLVVDDNPGDVRLLELALAGEPGEPVRWTAVDRLAPALEEVRKGTVDVVLLDLSLPDSVGTTTLARVRRAAPKVAIVALTATDDEVFQRQLREQGATEVLTKGPISHDRMMEILARAIGKPLPDLGGAPRVDGSARSVGPPAPSDPIDPRALREVRRLTTEADALIKDVLDAFFDQGSHLLARVTASIEAGDAEGVRANAHNLRSLCLQVGAQVLARTSSELERMGTAGDLSGAREVGARAQEEFGVARRELSGPTR